MSRATLGYSFCFIKLVIRILFRGKSHNRMVNENVKMFAPVSKLLCFPSLFFFFYLSCVLFCFVSLEALMLNKLHSLLLVHHACLPVEC